MDTVIQGEQVRVALYVWKLYDLSKYNCREAIFFNKRPKGKPCINSALKGMDGRGMDGMEWNGMEWNGMERNMELAAWLPASADVSR